MACTGKITPLIVTGRGLFEEVRISAAGPHGEQLILPIFIVNFFHMYLSSFGFFIEYIFDAVMF